MIGERWGVTDEEVARRYPCDEVVPSPAVELWRGVTIDAPTPRVWAWVRQIQLAPYSYDWLDNLGRRSPRELQECPDPRPGDAFSRIGGRFDVGRVLAVAPGEHLTARIMGAVLSYVITGDGARTRLVLKIVLPRRRWYSCALAAGDWPMARRQLLNLEHLAEADPAPPRIVRR